MEKMGSVRERKRKNTGGEVHRAPLSDCRHRSMQCVRGKIPTETTLDQTKHSGYWMTELYPDPTVCALCDRLCVTVRSVKSQCEQLTHRLLFDCITPYRYKRCCVCLCEHIQNIRTLTQNSLFFFFLLLSPQQASVVPLSNPSPDIPTERSCDSWQSRDLTGWS